MFLGLQDWAGQDKAVVLWQSGRVVEWYCGTVVVSSEITVRSTWTSYIDGGGDLTAR